ncbi:MAG: hypothetical protein IT308_05025 [Anaerolineaceae bacterium]|nr:hypothetical protein [Anaerolineaceae bacterium]
MHARLDIVLLIVLILSGCSLASPPQSSTKTPQPSITPTLTDLPATSTAMPTRTELPQTPTPDRQDLSTHAPTGETSSGMGTPIPEWEGVPVIPGANEGTPSGPGYLYSVDIPIEEAEQFYLEKMGNGGWSFTNSQRSETGLFGGPTIVMNFQRGSEAYNIMLVFSANDNYTMVLLTKVE